MKNKSATLSFTTKKHLLLILEAFKGYQVMVIFQGGTTLKTTIQRVCAGRVALRKEDNSILSLDPYSKRIDRLEIFDQGGLYCGDCGESLIPIFKLNCQVCGDGVKGLSVKKYNKKTLKIEELLDTVKKVRARSYADLARALGVTRQAVDIFMKSFKHDKGKFQALFDSHGESWRTLPRTSGVISIELNGKKYYDYAKNIQNYSYSLTRTHGKDIKIQLISTSKSFKKSTIEALTTRFAEPGALLFSETDTKFPFIIHHKPTDSYTIRIWDSKSKYFPSMVEAQTALKEFILHGKKFDTKKEKWAIQGLTKENLEILYIKNGLSAGEIASKLGGSALKIDYHLKKYGLK